MELESFCAPDNDRRDYLRRPFRVGDFVVCTDGHRLIAAPTDDETLPHNERIADTVTRIVADASAAEGFIPMPAVELPETTECVVCRGNGIVTKTECPECGGFGTVDAETDYSTYYDLECKSCWGEGEVAEPGDGSRCRRCFGTGTEYPRGKSIDVLGVRLNPAYVAPILDLPDLVVMADPTTHSMLLFRSGEFRGCIMGMTI